MLYTVSLPNAWMRGLPLIWYLVFILNSERNIRLIDRLLQPIKFIHCHRCQMLYTVSLPNAWMRGLPLIWYLVFILNSERNIRLIDRLL